MASALAPEEVAVLKRVYSFIGYAASPNGTPKEALIADAATFQEELHEIIVRHKGGHRPPAVEIGQVCSIDMPQQPGCSS